MHKVHIDFTGLSPGETDRLIEALFTWLKTESSAGPSDLYLEVEGRPLRHSIRIPVSSFDTSMRNISIMEIPVGQILYVTSEGHYCYFHILSGRTFRSRITFSDVRNLLPNEQFLCCNRGILLSMPFVSSCSGDAFVMKDGTSLSIRTKHKKEVLRQYESYRILHGTPPEGLIPERRRYTR